MKSRTQFRPLFAALATGLAAGSTQECLQAASFNSISDFSEDYLSHALFVSADGQSIAGSSGGSGPEGYVRSAADGHTLAGYGSDTPSWTTATVCTASTVVWRRLADVLREQRVDLGYRGSLDEASAISPEGRFVASSGTVASTFPQEGFVADITALPTPSPAPFGGSNRTLPGRIQAEDYDLGGPLVGYFDTTPGNSGGSYRSDGVDIVANSDGIGGTAVVLSSREWMDYSANVADSGPYVLRFRVARNGLGNGALRVLTGVSNGSLVPLVPSLAVPNTGSSWDYTIVEADVNLASGPQIIRLQCTVGDVAVNWFELVRRGLRREVWTGVPGNPVSQIPLNRTPNSIDVLATMETPQNWANNHGTRLRGYLRASATGKYRFWVAASDSSELWLSNSPNPANRVRIASNTSRTGFRQWNRFSSQRSAAISLVAGQSYYLEVLQKEGSGSDSLSVGWSRPGQGTSAPSEIIPTAAVSPFVP